MPVHFVYMLKASACLSVIYLFYVLLLKNSTYYNLNRYLLLLYCVLACIIPFINVNVFITTGQFDSIMLFKELPAFSPSVDTNDAPGFTGISITALLTGLFISGVFILLIRLIVQFVSLWKMHLKATLLQDGKVKIFHINEPIIPFSYFNNIYLNKYNYNAEELTEIVNHELAHVKQKHAIDILVTEILCIVNWYNPIVWLLKKAIKENLEFIADDEVIKKGADKKCYQYLLLKVTGNVSFSIANNLNFLSLKNRISMMNRTKASAFHLLKFVIFIPIATILLLAFRNKQEIPITKQAEKISAAKTYTLKSLTYAIPDKQIAAIVKKEQDKSLFKLDQAMNVDFDLFLNEQDRLRALLQKSGYDVAKGGYKNNGKYGIIFMVDTTLGNNNLSINVNINLTRNGVFKSREEFSGNEEITEAFDLQNSSNTKPVVADNTAQTPGKGDDTSLNKTAAFNSNLLGIK